jgi:hypothetical protein
LSPSQESQNALDHGLRIFGAILVGLISTSAGSVLIDLFSGVTPVIVAADEQHATAAVLASTIYSLITIYAKGCFLLSRLAFPLRRSRCWLRSSSACFAIRDHSTSLVPLAACRRPKCAPLTQ